MEHEVLHISTHAEADVTVVSLSGELDSMNVTDLDAAFAPLLGGAHSLFVLELSDLEFIDSAGLGSLVALWERAMEKGCFLALGQVSPRVHDVLQITGLNCVLQPHGSVDAARTAVHQMRDAFPSKGERADA